MTENIACNAGWIICRDGEQIARHLDKAKAEAHRNELNTTIGDGHFIRPVWPEDK